MNWRKVWYFLWHDDSIWSWLVNIVLAFVLIKFIVYPGLGLLLGTNIPIVAVVSSSMHHEGNFNSWWDASEEDYDEFSITKDQFASFPLHRGFNKGDIMILKSASTVDVGDVIVFQSSKPDPIIHRVVRIVDQNHFQTKGDNFQTNARSLQDSIIDETNIDHDQVKGKAIIRVPFLGYIKIIFVKMLNMVM